MRGIPALALKSTSEMEPVAAGPGSILP